MPAIKLTALAIRKISMGRSKKEIADNVVKHWPEACRIASIDTVDEASHFLAQLCKESDWFKVTLEYASGKDYEGRRDLGNTVPGYGVRYKGRGLIQTTGFANYKSLQAETGWDVVANPQLLEQFPYALLSAAYFWRRNKINALIKGKDYIADVTAVTRRVNGGRNGLSDRIASYSVAKAVLIELQAKQDGQKIAAPILEEPVPVKTPSQTLEVKGAVGLGGLGLLGTVNSAVNTISDNSDTLLNFSTLLQTGGWLIAAGVVGYIAYAIYQRRIETLRGTET